MDGPVCDDSDEAIRAIADPVQRAVRLRAIAKDNLTLTATQSRMYGDAIAEMRGDRERRVGWIAALLDVSPTRIYDVLRRRTRQLATKGASA